MKKKEKIKNKNSFFKRFYPTYMYKRVEDIPLELIKKQNIELIILDMDNTLIDIHKRYKKELKDWIDLMKENGVSLCILSNSPFKDKVKKIAGELGLVFEFNATKPLLKGFKKVLKYNEVPKDRILMVGDQMFTDIWGGNRIGVKTVLVEPINSKESIFSKVQRPIENNILKRYGKEGIEK